MNTQNVDSGRLLDRLLALGDGHRDTGYNMAGQDLRAALFILGWFQRIRRAAQAVRLMASAGFAHEAAPLMRTMVEYGVAMKLITHEPYKGVDIYISKMQKTIRDWAEVTAATGSQGEPRSAEMEDILTWETDAESESLQRLLAFKHLCQEANEMDFYRYWWDMLPFSHASYEGSMVYIGEGPDHQLLDLAVDGNIVDPIRVSAAVLFMACDMVHAFMQDAPWQSELDAIERQIDSAR